VDDVVICCGSGCADRVVKLAIADAAGIKKTFAELPSKCGLQGHDQRSPSFVLGFSGMLHKTCKKRFAVGWLDD